MLFYRVLTISHCVSPTIGPSVGPSVRPSILRLIILNFLLLYRPCPTAHNIAVVYTSLLKGPSQESEKSDGF